MLGGNISAGQLERLNRFIRSGLSIKESFDALVLPFPKHEKQKRRQRSKKENKMHKKELKLWRMGVHPDQGLIPSKN
jgi:hypothetical protein